MKKIRRILLLSFVGIGLLFLLASVVAEVWFSAASAGMTTVTGVIEELGVFRRGMPTVAYTVEGETYRCPISGSARLMTCWWIPAIPPGPWIPTCG